MNGFSSSILSGIFRKYVLFLPVSLGIGFLYKNIVCENHCLNLIYLLCLAYAILLLIAVKKNLCLLTSQVLSVIIILFHNVILYFEIVNYGSYC